MQWEPDDSEKIWTRAVNLGAQGRYLPAWRTLAPLTDSITDSPKRTDRWASLAASTRASHLRQIGCGLPAAEWDALAQRLAPVEDGNVDAHAGDALADALVGGAADQLLTGDVSAASRCWADAGSVAYRAGQRTRVRWHWVGAEIALARGSLDQAHRESLTALREVADLGPRHRTKTELIAAAVCLARADAVAATSHLLAAQKLLSRGGWPTLWWPAALLWLDLLHAGDHEAAGAVAVQQGARAVQLIDLHLPEDYASEWRARTDVRRILEGAERYSARYGAAR